MAIVLRIRTQLGVWRIQNVQKTDTLGEIRDRVEREHKTDLQGRPFSDSTGKVQLADDLTVQQAGLSHGDVLFATVDESKTAVHEQTTSGKRITKDGRIVAQEFSDLSNKKGFRPGMMPLRSMKMAWTLNEFVALDQQFEFKIKRQEQPICSKAVVDKSVVQDFQAYMMNFDYRKIRIGFLYGKFNKDKSVKVEVIYEPPQDNTDATFNILEDPNEEYVDKLTSMLGLKKVGWIFAHPTRETGFHFSAPEVIFAAEQQLEAAQGLNDTQFITIKVTINEKNEMVSEAYQISRQCMEMVAEGVLQPSHNLGMCSVNSTFTAYVEGKPAAEVDNDFFLVAVPITPFESETFVSFFPKANREGVSQSASDLMRQLNKAGKEGWNYQSLVADFHLLLYIASCGIFNIDEDFPLICQSVVNKEIPINEGYILMLRSIAGMD